MAIHIGRPWRSRRGLLDLRQEWTHEQGRTHHLTALPPRPQANKLVVLLDACNGVVISSAERATPIWLAGYEVVTTCENLTAGSSARVSDLVISWKVASELR